MTLSFMSVFSTIFVDISVYLCVKLLNWYLSFVQSKKEDENQTFIQSKKVEERILKLEAEVASTQSEVRDKSMALVNLSTSERLGHAWVSCHPGII
jgi:hypothetical protein